MVPAPVVSSGECDSQFTLSTALFVLLDTARNMKSACVAAAVLVTAANERSPTINQLEKKYNGDVPESLNRLQMRHALFSAPVETAGSGAMLWNGDQSPRVKKERKPSLRGKWGSVIIGRHMDNILKETHAVSVMTQAPWKNSRKGQRRKGRSRDKNPQRDQETKRKALWTRVKFHADSNSVKTRHVSSGILPCVKITSLKTGCMFGDMPFPTC